MYSETEEDHLKTLEEIFTRLSDAGLTISLKKCAFGQTLVEFLGYTVDDKGITPLPRKLEAILTYPSPTTAKSLLGFLGALNYYRRSLPKVDKKRPAEILQPLYDAETQKAGPGFIKHWTENNLEESYKDAK